MEKLEYVETSGAPEAIGPYSQAVVVDGMVYCSGQIPFDPVTMEQVAGGIEAQTDQVLKNLAQVLQAAGSSLSRVVKTTVFLKSMDDFAAMNQVYARHFGDHRPARAAVQAARLPRDVDVEIECIARVG
ncbi:MAG: RidA family protein [Gemmatimonadota bacterium]